MKEAYMKNSSRRSKRIIAAAAASAVVAVPFLSGCNSDADNSNNESMDVVATTTQICDYAKEIAKDNVKLTCLLAPNASAHDHEMTPKQMNALSKAKLFMVNGVDLEHFLDSAVDASGFKGTMVVTSGILTANEVKDSSAAAKNDKDKPYTVDRGDQKVNVAPWPFAPEPGEQPEFEYDPHVWTSPKNAKVQVHNIGKALEKADPDHKDAYIQNTKDYEKKLDELDKWVNDSIVSVPESQRVLFTSHDAFGYFSRDYGVKFIGAALSDFNAQSDATAAHIKESAEEVKKSGAVALFAENSNNSKSVEAIAHAAGVKAIIGDDVLYGDSLGPKGSNGETYIKSIEHNVSTLTDAWGGKSPELPSDLK